MALSWRSHTGGDGGSGVRNPEIESGSGKVGAGMAEAEPRARARARRRGQRQKADHLACAANQTNATSKLDRADHEQRALGLPCPASINCF